MRVTAVIAVSAAAALAGLYTPSGQVEPARTTPVALAASVATPLPADVGDFRRGFRDGYREGYRDGFRDGRDYCDHHRRHDMRSFGGGDYERGYSDGYDRGYRAGFDNGCHRHYRR